MSTTARRALRKAISGPDALAFRQRIQRLEQRTEEPLEQLVRAVGYPIVTGTTPYLALRARAPRLERRVVDHAVYDAGTLVEVPFTRGSSVLAPPDDVAPLLAMAAADHAKRVQALSKEVTLDTKRREKLCEAICAALEGGPLAADELRARLPESLSISFGETGRKAGFPNLFGLVLRDLCCAGHVVRVQRERRLDREAVRYALSTRRWTVPPRAQALRELAERYFALAAPGTATGFAYWADATLTEARSAIQSCGLAEVAIEGWAEPAHLPEGLIDDLLSFDPPFPPRFAFVPFRDPFVSLTRDLRPLLAAEHRDVPLADWRGRVVGAGGGSIVHQHFVLYGGQIAGIWEYDTGSGRVDYAPLAPLATRPKRLADQLAEELAEWIQRELGDARFYGDDRGDGYGRLSEVVASWRF
jgi:hypothetical protein